MAPIFGLPAQAPRQNLAFRLRLFYVAVFAVGGVHLPFWPVWLNARGLDDTAVGILLAASIWVRIAITPLAAHFADALGERKRPIALFASVSVVAFAWFAVADGFWWLLAASLAFGLAWAPIMPLGESLVLLIAYEKKLDYGRLRLWGSLAFMAAAALAGLILEGRSTDLIFWMLLAACLANAMACLALPDHPPSRAYSAEPTPPSLLRRSSRFGCEGWKQPLRLRRLDRRAKEGRPPIAEARPRMPIARLLRDRMFLLFLASAGCIQASHAVLYAFGSLHWRAIGLSEDVIGLLWAEGVIAEIVLFAFGQPLLRKLGPINLLIIGAASGILRWTATGFAVELSALLMLQILHAFTFGAAHLGAMHFIAQSVRPGMSASAQSLYSAAVGGVALGLATLLSGPLYGTLNSAAFLVMAALSAAGCVGAVVLLLRWHGQQIG